MLQTHRPSLFVISLPRSLSSFAFHLCRKSLQMKEPTWTTDGEILNHDRYLLGPLEQREVFEKYLTFEHEPYDCARVNSYLSKVVFPFEYCYKDVVQPFAVAQWGSERPLSCLASQMTFLSIIPDVAHVAMRMLARKWYYPKKAAPSNLGLKEGLVHGLYLASEAIKKLPGPKVSFTDLITDQNVLWQNLYEHYPTTDIREHNYLDRAFCYSRARVRAQHSTVEYRDVLDIYKRLSPS
jgi:hypothetical protein